MEIREKIGKNIAGRRKAQELTQLQLAEKAYLSQAIISKAEAGIKSPSAESLERIANALSCKITDLIQ